MTVFTTLPARHDHTPTFTDRLGAPRGESVTLRMHTTLPVTGVGFMVVRSGELEAHAASAVPGRPGWFEYTLTLEQDVTRYAWQLALPDDHVNLTMSGLHRTRRAFRDWFQYLAGYRAPEWAWGSVFYQIFPDRFRNGDETSDVQDGEYEYAGASVFRVPWNTVPDRRGDIHGHYGGDLQGITEKLPYLTELGVNALWLTPIFVSPSNHRYDISDYRQIDPHLGGQAAYDDLLGACRDAGVRVVLDGVFNHASRGFFQFSDLLEQGQDSAYLDWFHAGPFPLSPYDDARPANYEAWWGNRALPKFNTDTLAVREFLWDVAEFWMRFGIDGWRLDVPNEIDDDSFWQEFRRRVKAINPDAYIVGEIWGDAHRWLQGDQFDAVMNYPFTRPCLAYFGARTLDHSMNEVSGTGHVDPMTTEAFAARMTEVASTYPLEIVQAQLNLQNKSKPVYATLERAIEARMKGLVAVSREAAELLAQRGLMPVPGGYTWRSDSRLTLASPLRLTEEQAMSFVQRVACPTQLVVAADGMLAKHQALLQRLPFSREQLPGGHHLHLNDEAGATFVADCFNRFFAIP